MTTKQKVKKRVYKPSYSISVRLGLDTIARRTVPVDRFERRALEWIADMKWWHINKTQLKFRAKYELSKKKKSKQ
jgi:hypothetical protein